jgi:hypothetical protein
MRNQREVALQRHRSVSVGQVNPPAKSGNESGNGT